MNELQLLNNLSKIVVFLLLFFSFFLVTVSSNKQKSNQLFAVFLMLIAFDMTGFFLNDWYQKKPIVDYLRNSSTLLQLPILYFYVRSVCYSNFSLKFKDCIHGLLFLSFFIFFSIFSTSKTIFFALQTIGEVQYIGYMILIFMTLNQYKKNYLQSYTNPENLSYKWLSQMIVVLLIAHLFVVTKFLFGFSNDLNLQFLTKKSAIQFLFTQIRSTCSWSFESQINPIFNRFKICSNFTWNLFTFLKIRHRSGK
jgi:hypothetical protein